MHHKATVSLGGLEGKGDSLAQPCFVTPLMTAAKVRIALLSAPGSLLPGWQRRGYLAAQSPCSRAVWQHTVSSLQTDSFQRVPESAVRPSTHPSCKGMCTALGGGPLGQPCCFSALLRCQSLLQGKTTVHTCLHMLTSSTVLSREAEEGLYQSY